MISSVVIGDREIGRGRPAYVVAEIGINHNGDMALARQCIDAAIGAGVDAVKVQNYRTEDFIADHSLTYEYVSQGRTVVEPQYDLFKRCELSPEDLAGLAEYCRHRGMGFHSTPTNVEGVRQLAALGVPVLKNGSDFLGHLPLIRAMGETGLPTVLSTGMATLADIDDAVRAFRETGNRQLVLLACTSCYPTPAEEVNLRRMPALAAAFGCPAGFSDHTEGTAAAVAAVALGACWIEKHFTLDRTLPGPDHRFSSDPREIAELVRMVRFAERALGESAIAPTAGEMAARQGFRLSCVTTSPLAEGTCLAATDIAFRRPGEGLPPSAVNQLIGRRLSRSLPAGHVLSNRDLA